MADPLADRYGAGDARWLTPEDIKRSSNDPLQERYGLLPLPPPPKPQPRAELRNLAPRPADPLTPIYENLSPIAGGAGLGEAASQAGQALWHGDKAKAAEIGLPALFGAILPVPGAKGAGKVAPRVDPLGYYSQALNAAENLSRKSGPSQGFLNDLTKAGVKKAELEATGLDKLLASKPNITRDEIVQHLEANRVEVREARYQTNEGAIDAMMRRSGLSREAAQRQVEMSDRSAPKWSQYSLDPSNPTYRETVLHLGPSGRAREIEARMKDNQRELHDIHQANPDLEQIRRDYAIAKLAGETPDAPGWKPGQASSAAKAQRMLEDDPRLARVRTLHDENNAMLDELKQINAGRFQGGHWSEPNVIAHMRTSVQKDAQGRPVFLLDELQSDWGQRVRDAGGPRDEAKVAELVRREAEASQGLSNLRKEMADTLGERIDLNGLAPVSWLRNVADRLPQSSPERAKIESALSDYRLANAELATVNASVPGHPLVNTTDQWTTTALRRLIQQANEAGAEGVAITPGQLQNERFNLSKHVGALRYNPDTHELNFTDPVTAQQWARPSGTFTPVGWSRVPDKVPPDRLAEHVGKETAEKLLAQPVVSEANKKLYYQEPGWHELRDLTSVEMGGHGMRATYDKMYPDKLAAMLKKMDPQHPGRSETQLIGESGSPFPEAAAPGERFGYKPAAFHYFPLTPAVKEAVKKGLPLFGLASLAGPDLADSLREFYQDDELPPAP